MVQEDELRERLANYLAGKLSLASFERWLANADSPVVVDESDRVFKRVAKINLLISEFHDHVINENVFMDELVAFVNDINEPLAKPIAVFVPPPKTAALSAIWLHHSEFALG